MPVVVPLIETPLTLSVVVPVPCAEVRVDVVQVDADGGVGDLVGFPDASSPIEMVVPGEFHTAMPAVSVAAHRLRPRGSR